MIASTKRCSKCRETKALNGFHSQPSGKYGRHSYCRLCANTIQRGRNRFSDPAQKRRWQLKGRYGLTEDDVAAMLARQDGKCAICRNPPAKVNVDHCHATGRVRGILCHRCNIRLNAIDDAEFRIPAMRYVGLGCANG